MKQFLLFTLSIVCISNATAQRNKINVGVEGSASSIFLDYTDKDFFDRSIGYSAAGTIQYNFPRLFSIRTNVAYERKGATSEWPLYSNTNYDGRIEKMNFNFDYFSMPLLLRITLGNKIHCFANAGPFLGYLLKQEVRYTWAGEAKREDHTDSFNRLDAGIAAGAGLGFTARKKFIFSLEVRHNGGLKDVLKNTAYPSDETLKTLSTNILIGICYKLGERE